MDSPGAAGLARAPSEQPDLSARTLPEPTVSGWAKAVCALTGSLGVVSGFLIFVLWLEQIKERVTTWHFIAILVIAATLSLIFEFLKSQIDSEGESWYPHRLVTSFVLLAIFELCVMGAHSTAALYWSDDRQEKANVGNVLLGDILTDPATQAATATRPVPPWYEQPVIHTALVMLLWLFVGGAVAWRLAGAVWSSKIQETSAAGWRSLIPIGRGALAGGGAGVIGALGSFCLYVLFARLIKEYSWIADRPENWAKSVQALFDVTNQQELHPYIKYVLLGTYAAIQGIGAGLINLFPHWGAKLLIVLLVALPIALLYMIIKYRPGGLVAFIAYGALAASLLVVIVPLLADMRRVANILLVVAVGWGSTGLVLGAMIPALSGPAKHRRDWSLVAFAAAVILGIATRAAWSTVPIRTMFAGGTVFFLIIWWVLRRGAETQKYWPVLALSVATIVFGVTRSIQRTGFLDINRQAFLLVQEEPLNFAETDWAKKARMKALAERKFFIPDLSKYTALSNFTGMGLPPGVQSPIPSNLLPKGGWSGLGTGFWMGWKPCDRASMLGQMCDYEEHVLTALKAPALPKSLVDSVEAERDAYLQRLTDIENPNYKCESFAELGRRLGIFALDPRHPAPAPRREPRFSAAEIQAQRAKIAEIDRIWNIPRASDKEIEDLQKKADDWLQGFSTLDKADTKEPAEMGRLKTSGKPLLKSVHAQLINLERACDSETRAARIAPEVQAAMHEAVAGHLGRARDRLRAMESDLSIGYVKVLLADFEQLAKDIRTRPRRVEEQKRALDDFSKNWPWDELLATINTAITDLDALLASLTKDPQTSQDYVQTRKTLVALKCTVTEEKKKLDTWVRNTDEQLEHIKRLEVAMTTSVGFWATIGMLVTWSLRLKSKAAEEADK